MPLSGRYRQLRQWELLRFLALPRRSNGIPNLTVNEFETEGEKRTFTMTFSQAPPLWLMMLDGQPLTMGGLFCGSEERVVRGWYQIEEAGKNEDLLS